MLRISKFPRCGTLRGKRRVQRKQLADNPEALPSTPRSFGRSVDTSCGNPASQQHENAIVSGVGSCWWMLSRKGGVCGDVPIPIAIPWSSLGHGLLTTRRPPRAVLALVNELLRITHACSIFSPRASEIALHPVLR